MQYNKLPAKIKSTFPNENLLARTVARSNRHGKFITVITTEGDRFRFQQTASGKTWSQTYAPEPKAASQPKVDQKPATTEGEVPTFDPIEEFGSMPTTNQLEELDLLPDEE